VGVEAAAPDLSAGVDVDAATYFLSTLRTAFTRSMTLGNDISGELPDAVDLSRFCLSGIGIVRSREWHEEIDVRLGLAGADGPSILRSLAK
jgi:hypothetical protein